MKTQPYNQKFVKRVLKAFREIKKGKYITELLVFEYFKTAQVEV